MQTAAEYPSGTTSVCGAFSEFYRGIVGSDEFPPMGPSADGVITNPTPAVLLWKAGCSRREPGLTPAADLSIPQWKTFTELERCATSAS